MPDTELMDEVLAIITEVPALHDQRVVECSLLDPDQREAEQELSDAPAEVAALVPDCRSAYCVGGWALVLRGYRHDRTVHGWVGPDGVRLISPPLLTLAANELGIPFAEARKGIFWEDNTLEEIRLWVGFYKGEIDRDDLEFRLELKSDG